MNNYILKLNNLDFNTLLKNNKDARWNPIAIADIEKQLNINTDNHDFNYKITKNLAYNFQYLEFLQKQIYELNLSSNLQKMLYKNYLITGMSIIETIFAFLVRKNNLWKKESWVKDKKHSSNYQNSKIVIRDGVQYKIGKYSYKKVKEFYKHLDFSDLIQIVRDNKLISNISSYNWKILSNMKKQRNRVHIRITDSVSTEYNDFDIYSYLNTKIFLYCIIKNSAVISNNDESKIVFNFLSLTEEEMNRYKRN